MKLTVVGSGPAGLYSALTASEQGAKVTLVDRSERLGGTCVLFGCIPSKAMMSPLFLSYASQKYGKSVEFSYSELEEFARSVVQRVSKGVEYMLESAGVEVVKGEAKLNSGKIEVGGQILESDSVIVATGTEKPQIPGTIASDDLHFLDREFNTVLLVGGGVGGVEYGWLLHLAKKKVTIVEREELLLPGHDRDLRASVTSHFKRLGIDVRTNSVAEISDKVKINGGLEDFDLVVFTFGRKPAVKGFENLVGNKWIGVNEYMETKINHVYAAGDVTGTFTAHEAIHKGIIAGLNATGTRRSYRGEGVPKVLYTHPEIAYVGNTDGKCVKLSMAEVVRAVAERSTEGFIKVCVNEDGTLRGGVAFGERAEDIVSTLSLLIQLHVKVQDAKELMFPHPSYLEGLWEALRRLKP